MYIDYFLKTTSSIIAFVFIVYRHHYTKVSVEKNQTKLKIMIMIKIVIKQCVINYHSLNSGDGIRQISRSLCSKIHSVPKIYTCQASRRST